MAIQVNSGDRSVWMSTRRMAENLAISTDTLSRMMRRGLFEDGVHYRRSNPLSPASPRLWHRDRVSSVLFKVDA